MLEGFGFFLVASRQSLVVSLEDFLPLCSSLFTLHSSLLTPSIPPQSPALRPESILGLIFWLI
jgi:hypothetical protein